jgi:hypothetical protein
VLTLGEWAKLSEFDRAVIRDPDLKYCKGTGESLERTWHEKLNQTWQGFLRMLVI